MTVLGRIMLPLDIVVPILTRLPLGLLDEIVPVRLRGALEKN